MIFPEQRIHIFKELFNGGYQGPKAVPLHAEVALGVRGGIAPTLS
jgi:hypothetical protein